MSAAMIDAAGVRALLGLDELIEPVSKALQVASAGGADTGLIVMYPDANRAHGDVFVKTGVISGAPIHVVKVAPRFAINSQRGEPQGGFVAILDSKTGHAVAFLDDQHYISDIRTAAAGGLAARMLAPLTVRVAGVLGSGVQAYWQAIALHRERPFQELAIWARNRARAQALADRLDDDLPGIAIRVVEEVESVVRASDVLITATASREPLVRGEWLHPGQHITAVGADDPSKCELDAAALKRGSVFVDGKIEATGNGDIHRAITEGFYHVSEIRGELGAVLSGAIPGRSSPHEITIAKMVGLGAQDVAAATIIAKKLGLVSGERALSLKG